MIPRRLLFFLPDNVWTFIIFAFYFIQRRHRHCLALQRGIRPVAQSLYFTSLVGHYYILKHFHFLTYPGMIYIFSEIPTSLLSLLLDISFVGLYMYIIMPYR